MSSINFYKVWHLPLSTENQINLPGEYINLEEIKCPEGFEKIWPYLQEYRIHFSDLKIDKDYVGFISASFKDKFGSESLELLKFKINDEFNEDLIPIVVSQKEWYNLTCLYHVGIEKYIQYYCDQCNIDEKYLHQPIFYCNSFICKTEIYLKARLIFQKNISNLFNYFDNKLDFAGTIYNDVRKGGCLCERLMGLTIMSMCKTFESGITTLNIGNFVQ
jgi:hypothetical protein